jgi:hypothetical protein
MFVARLEADTQHGLNLKNDRFISAKVKGFDFSLAIGLTERTKLKS